MKPSLNRISSHLPLQQLETDPAATGQDEIFNQILSSIPSTWPELGNPKSAWDSSASVSSGPYDESPLVASQHHISSGSMENSTTGMVQLNQRHRQQQIFVPAMTAGQPPGGNGIYNGYQQMETIQQQFPQNYGGAGSGAGQTPTTSVSTISGSAGRGAGPPPRQRVRARRGQATDPHSIAERIRRERIAERMKALQELVPNPNKTDKASMLDEIIDYVKFLQLQVKVLSMSRLGGTAAVAPLASDISTEESGRANGAAGNDSQALTEHQVAKLMAEDMGSAMQYLQGKGLCIMPISLASAISTATYRPPLNPGLVSMPTQLPSYDSNVVVAVDDAAPACHNMSVLTLQSNVINGTGNAELLRSSGDKDSFVGANN